MALLLSPLFAYDRSHRPSLTSPSVKETEAGWTITLAMPGLTARDVAVDVSRPASAGKNPHLVIHADHHHLRHSMQLPANADANHIVANLKHGLLRVTVPRRPLRTWTVPVFSEAPSTASEPEEANVSVCVPGIGAEEVSVNVEEDTLFVTAQSKHGFGDVAEAFKLPERAVPDRIYAICQHGVITVRVPLAPFSHVKVDVLSDGSATEPSKDTNCDENTLLQITVPGFSASDISAEVIAGGAKKAVLHLSASRDVTDGKKSARCGISRAVALPPGTPASAVKVACANGVLRVWMPKAELPKPAETRIVVTELDDHPSAPATAGNGGSAAGGAHPAPAVESAALAAPRAMSCPAELLPAQEVAALETAAPAVKTEEQDVVKEQPAANNKKSAVQKKKGGQKENNSAAPDATAASAVDSAARPSTPPAAEAEKESSKKKKHHGNNKAGKQKRGKSPQQQEEVRPESAVAASDIVLTEKN